MEANSGKMENLLNLALDATKTEMEKSSDLSVGYDMDVKYMESDRKVFWKHRGIKKPDQKALSGAGCIDRYLRSFQ